GVRRTADLELPRPPAVEASPPQRRVDDPRALGGRIRLRAKGRPLIGTCRHDDARGNLERLVEVLELRDVIPFEMFAGFGACVERRGKHAPVFQAVLEVADVRRTELEKELPDAPPFGSRLECHIQVCLADADTRNKTERGLEILADLLPAEREVPAIVRIV